MSEYNPDKWVILKLVSDKTVYKVLAGNTGGYLDSDTWRLSSGLERIEEEGDFYIMHNYSGSVYRCHKKSEGFTALTADKFRQIEKTTKEDGYSVETVTPEEYLEETE